MKGVLPDDAVAFLCSILPKEHADELAAECARRRLGGRGRRVLAGRRLSIEFSSPFVLQDQDSGKLSYRVRMRSSEDGPVSEAIVNGGVGAHVSLTARRLGMRVVHVRRSDTCVWCPPGLFEDEIPACTEHRCGETQCKEREAEDGKENRTL